jgi:MFS family permease
MQSDIRFGILQTVLSASMIAAPILLTNKLKQMKLGDVLSISFLVIGFLIMLISLIIHQSVFSINQGFLSYMILLVLCFIIGVFVTAVNIAVQTLFQNIVPIEFMGRTSTVLGLFTAIAIPIGQMIFGYLYDIINPGYVILINGSIIIMVVIVYYRRMHQIEHHDQKEIKENLSESRVALNEI